MAEFRISLSFTNNLLQTFLIDIFDKAGIKLIETKTMIPGFEYNSNLLSINYNSEIIYLLYQTKTDLINNVKKSNKLIEFLIQMKKKVNPKNMIVIFYQARFSTIDEMKKRKLYYFITVVLGMKCIELANSLELIDFTYNLKDSLTSKETKSKLHFFDVKPNLKTHLCDIEGIKNKQWVKHLMCMNGISESRAISIVKVFPDISTLYNVYLSDQYSNEEKETLIDDIQVVNMSKSSKKKLGGILSTKIYKFFTSEDPNLII